MCLFVYVICVLPQIISVLLCCTWAFVLCLSTRASRGRPQALPASPAFDGRGQLSFFFLLALTEFPLASHLLCCLFLILKPGVLLLVCCGYDPNSSFTREHEGRRRWEWVGRSRQEKQAQECETQESVVLWNWVLPYSALGTVSGVERSWGTLKADSYWTFCWGIYNLSK